MKNETISFTGRELGGTAQFEAVVNIEGIANWHVGFPASGDKKADVIAMLRRIADNIERGPRIDR